MWRSGRRGGRDEVVTSGLSKGDDDYRIALDHLAAWVRFADGKATILAAGLAAILALLGNRLDSIARALNGGCPHSFLVGTLGCLCLAAVAWTIYWLMSAINPRSTVSRAGLNRFAWPTLADSGGDALARHIATTPAAQDAWAQVLDLAAIAKKKFRDTRRAGYGFYLTLLLGVAVVTLSALSEV